MDSFQISMNAIEAQITATLMLSVLTPLVASSVIVCLDLRAVESVAQVRLLQINIIMLAIVVTISQFHIPQLNRHQ